MYVYPDSDVWLLENVPLGPDYEHTVLWPGIQQQQDWFTSHARHHFENVSYQRHAANQISLQVQAEQAMTCNYMCFVNNAFGGRMFYAFVTDVTYISNKSCVITYQIDVMQTFLFDAELEQCWVEREHAATDVAGDNLKPEPIDTGPMIISTWENSGYFENYSILMSDIMIQS